MTLKAYFIAREGREEFFKEKYFKTNGSLKGPGTSSFPVYLNDFDSVEDL